MRYVQWMNRGVKMNRKERRKMYRNGVNPKTIMDQYRKEAYEAGFHDGIKHTADSIMVITAECLHTHLGLGKQRLPEIMEWIHINIDSFNSGHLVPSDIDLMKEELKKLNVVFK